MDQEALYVTGLDEIAWGCLLLAATLAIHGVGMLFTLRFTELLKAELPDRRGLARGVLVIIAAAWCITFVHLVEVLVWAGFFVWKDAMPNASTAYYFALLDYTTLGSRYDLPVRWRLLEGMLAMAGLMTFAWSTGVLLALAQEFQQHQLRLIARHRGTRQHAPPSPPPGSST
jgi:hypothetical protein